MRERIQAAKIFDRRSATYDELDWVGDQRFLDRFKRFADLFQTDVVLDVATGTGELLYNMYLWVELVVGIDISAKMLLIAKEKLWKHGNRAFLVLGHGESLPFPEKFFDLVTCRNGLHHFSNPKLGINEMRRVLKPRKHIIISETIIPDESIRSLWTYIVQLKDVGRHERFYFTRNEFEDYLSGLGLEIVDSYVYVQRVSIKNWLEKGQVPKNKQQLILNRLLKSSGQEKTVMEMQSVDDDINLSKHIVTVKITPKQAEGA